MDAQRAREAGPDAVAGAKAVRRRVPLWLEVLFWALVTSALIHSL